MGGVRVSGPTGRDQTYTPQGELTFGEGGGAKGGVKGVGFWGLELVMCCLRKLPGRGWFGGGWKGGFQDPLPVGLVLSHRDQALNGEDAGGGSWAGGRGAGDRYGGGLLPQKPASLVPATPTHAEMIAGLDELYGREKRLSEKVEEAKGRLEKARAKVLEEEEGMAKVEGELQEVNDQVEAHLKEEEERKERRRRRKRLAVMIWRMMLLWRRQAALRRLGIRVEVGKRRRVAWQVLFAGGRGGVGRGGRGGGGGGGWGGGCGGSNSPVASFV